MGPSGRRATRARSRAANHGMPRADVRRAPYRRSSFAPMGWLRAAWRLPKDRLRMGLGSAAEDATTAKARCAGACEAGAFYLVVHVRSAVGRFDFPGPSR